MPWPFNQLFCRTSNQRLKKENKELLEQVEKLRRDLANSRQSHRKFLRKIITDLLSQTKPLKSMLTQ